MGDARLHGLGSSQRCGILENRRNGFGREEGLISMGCSEGILLLSDSRPSRVVQYFAYHGTVTHSIIRC